MFIFIILRSGVCQRAFFLFSFIRLLVFGISLNPLFLRWNLRNIVIFLFSPFKMMKIFFFVSFFLYNILVFTPPTLIYHSASFWEIFIRHSLDYISPFYFLFSFPVLLGENCHTVLYKFKVYNTMIGINTSWNDDHNKFTEHLSSHNLHEILPCTPCCI